MLEILSPTHEAYYYYSVPRLQRRLKIPGQTIIDQNHACFFSRNPEFSNEAAKVFRRGNSYREKSGFLASVSRQIGVQTQLDFKLILINSPSFRHNRILSPGFLFPDAIPNPVYIQFD